MCEGTRAADDTYIVFDEFSDFLNSLAMCIRCLKALNEDKTMWKWAIISLHNALQGAMVCHLTGTAGVGAGRRDYTKKMMEWHDRDRRGEIRRKPLGETILGIQSHKIVDSKDFPPVEKLARAKELFVRLSDESKRIEREVGAIIRVTENQKRAFEKLDVLRNDFSHFTPKGWSIEVSGLPTIFINLINLIETISKDPWSFRHMSTDQKSRSDRLISEARTCLKTLDPEIA